LTFKAYFMIIFELALKRKCVKTKQFKYYHEMHLKRHINLIKIWLKVLSLYIFKDEGLNWSKFIFEEKLVLNFLEIWETKIYLIFFNNNLALITHSTFWLKKNQSTWPNVHAKRGKTLNTPCYDIDGWRKR